MIAAKDVKANTSLHSNPISAPDSCCRCYHYVAESLLSDSVSL